MKKQLIILLAAVSLFALAQSPQRFPGGVIGKYFQKSGSSSDSVLLGNGQTKAIKDIKTDTLSLSHRIDTKEPAITSGITSQYYRGDKTFQTLDKAAVGLSNVDNTSDANKPISTATQNALNLKANLSGATFTGNISATNLSGTNTGDETLSTIKSKLGAASSVNDGYLAYGDWAAFNGKQNALGYTPENSANKGTANGYVPLDASSKISTTYLPDAILGSVKYKGTLNASGGGYPASPSKGDYYVVSTPGTIGSVAYTNGDWAVYNGTTWDAILQGHYVTSVFGRTGAVTANTGDYNTDQVTEGSSNKYYTDTRARSAISLTTTGNSGPATYNLGVFNVPNYTLSGLGGISSAALSTTTVGLTATSGTESGVSSLTVNAASGYAIPTTTAVNNAATAYSWGNHASAGYAKADGSNAAGSNWGISITGNANTATTAGTATTAVTATNAVTAGDLVKNSGSPSPGKVLVATDVAGHSTWTGDVLENLYAYGVQWNTSYGDPTLTRIGNLALHASLPIQNKIKGCLLDDAGNVAMYLSSTNWNTTLDGSKGQVMVEIPEYYYKGSRSGYYYSMMISEFPLPGYKHAPKRYISAYEASIQRSTGKLCSVQNFSADYRGGDNTSTWDGTYRSLLGMPVTNLSRTAFRDAARLRAATNANNPKGWNCLDYSLYKDICWLFYIEYATFNSQLPFGAKDSNGYATGGLGDGVTTMTDWGTYNNYNPIVPCGATNSYGNGSGRSTYTTGTLTFTPNRYRGIENPFGHIWKWTDGVNIHVIGGSAEARVSRTPESYSDSTSEGYELRGSLPGSSGYMVSPIYMTPDNNEGDILPNTVGGSSSSYWCDYYYADNSLDGVHGLLVGGNAVIGVGAGLACSGSDIAPSRSYANIGSRLCFIP